MPWRVALSSRARRDRASLSATDRAAVDAALRHLADDPSSVDFKKLAGGSRIWRLRVGRWRALLDLDSRVGLMTVTRILDRREAYRG